MVIFFNSFLDEIWGFELKLLVCCQVMSCFFVSYSKNLRQLLMGDDTGTHENATMMVILLMRQAFVNSRMDSLCSDYECVD